MRRPREEEESDGAGADADRPAASAAGGRLLRPVVIISIALVLLAALAVGGTVAYVRGEWYVGEAHGHVAVFRGVPGSFLGIRLQHEKQEYADLTSLTDGDRHRVIDSIDATSESDAIRIAMSLAPTGSASPTVTAPVPSTPSSAASPTDNVPSG